MKAAVFIKRDTPSALDCAVQVGKTLAQFGITPLFDACYEGKGLQGEFFPAHALAQVADVVIAVGGDGTILHAAKHRSTNHAKRICL